MTETTESALIQQVRRGRQECFRPLVERYQNRVFVLACSLVGNPTEAQDIAQDVFLAAYEKLHTLSDPTRFGPWLFGITRNLCFGALRKRNVIHEPLEAHQDHLAGNVVPLYVRREGQEDPLTALLDRLNRLPEKYQQVLRLKYLEDYSYQDIADMLDLSVDLVRSRLFEGRKLLRERLDQLRGTSNE